jgi:hypothetical protein
MKNLLLGVLLVVGIAAGCASAPAAAPQGGCCETNSQKSVETDRAKLIAEGKAYYDETGKFHDHATTATVWTVCNCVVCDRKDKCCGPSHCVCNPN